MNAEREKFFEDSGVTDAKPFLQGKNSDIQLVREWSLENIQKMINKLKDIIFSSKGTVLEGVKKQDGVVEQMTSVAALANLNVFLASKAFDAIASILSAFTSGNFTTVQKNTKIEVVAPGITMFITIIEKSHQDKDFFENQIHTENVFLYEFWFSVSQGQAIGQFNDFRAYEDLKQGYRTRISYLGKKIGNPEISFDDIKKLQDEIKYYGLQLNQISKKQAELEIKENERIQEEVFKDINDKQAEMFEKYQSYEKKLKRETYPPALEPGESEELVLDEDLQPIGSLSFEVEESICGKDLREQVNQTKQKPYYSICSLLITMPDGIKYLGSGWLASFKNIISDDDWVNNVVMTSGHCVFVNKKFPKKITVIPGRNINDKPYGEFIASQNHLRVSQEWKKSKDSDYDYGAILIPRIQKPDWGGMSWVNLPTKDLEQKETINTGYPGDKQNGSLWTAHGPITSVKPHKVEYMNDTYGGQSGSPAYLDEEQLRVIGIHGYGGCPNKAVRLTKNVIENMKVWAKENIYSQEK